MFSCSQSSTSSSPIITNQTILFLQKCHHFRCASHAKIRSLINLRLPGARYGAPLLCLQSQNCLQFCCGKSGARLHRFQIWPRCPQFFFLFTISPSATQFPFFFSLYYCLFISLKKICFYLIFFLVRLWLDREDSDKQSSSLENDEDSTVCIFDSLLI